MRGSVPSCCWDSEGSSEREEPGALNRRVGKREELVGERKEKCRRFLKRELPHRRLFVNYTNQKYLRCRSGLLVRRMAREAQGKLQREHEEG